MSPPSAHERLDDYRRGTYAPGFIRIMKVISSYYYHYIYMLYMLIIHTYHYYELTKGTTYICNVSYRERMYGNYYYYYYLHSVISFIYTPRKVIYTYGRQGLVGDHISNKNNFD